MLKKVGQVAMFLFIGAALIALPIVFFKGAIWASDVLLQPLIHIGWWVLGLSLFILLPLAVFKKLRGHVAILLLYSSFLYGLIAWLTGFVITYHWWGILGVVIGLFIAGVGVVPTGLLASAFHGWAGFVPLIVLLVLTFGTRFVAFALGESADRHAQKMAFEAIFSNSKQ